MRMLCGEGEPRDNAVEKWEMATSYRWASTAASPRRSRFLKERCLKSDRKRYVSDGIYTRCADHSPRTHSECSSCRFNSLVIWWKQSTASATRSIISRRSHTTWWIVTLGGVSYKPSVSIRRGVSKQKKILTLAAATKASFHERLANVALTHSFRSGVAVRGSRAARGVGASSSLSGLERHRWVKSDKKRLNV